MVEVRQCTGIVLSKCEVSLRNLVLAFAAQSLFLRDSICKIGQRFAAFELSILNYAFILSVPLFGDELQIRTRVSIARKVAGPCNEGLSLMLARGNRVNANGRYNGRVRQLGLGGDDTICDVMID